MKRRFHPEASREVRAQSLYYEEQRWRLGSEFLDELRLAVKKIEANPEQYQLLEEHVRVYRFKQFPFHLYYRYYVERDEVVIFAVAHTKRRPGYWHKRLDEEGM